VETTAIIEPVAGNGYRAIGASGLSSGLSAEGATAEDAMNRLDALVRDRKAHGAKVVTLNVGDPHPWSKDAGWLRDNPLYDAWRQSMEDYRQQLDEDPDAL
jgi:hypothetical protein